MPANVGESRSGQKRSKGRIDKALDKAGVEDKTISSRRPKPLIAAAMAGNAAWRGGSVLRRVSGNALAAALLSPRDQAFRQLLINCGGVGGTPGPCPTGIGELGTVDTTTPVQPTPSPPLTKAPAKILTGALSMKHIESANAGWSASMTPIERSAVAEFHRTNDIVNGVLRGNPPKTKGLVDVTPDDLEKAKAVVGEVDAAFAKVKPTTKDTVFYRGTGVDPGEVGKVFQDAGYMHVSGSSTHANLFGGYFTEVHIPAGTKVVPMRISAGPMEKGAGSENEAVLPRGSSFEFKGWKEGKKGQKIAIMQMVSSK